MKPLRVEIQNIVETVFQNNGFDQKHAQIVVSNRPDLADFQCNGALPIAKSQGINPREVGEKILQDLKPLMPWAELSLAGPGFINISLSNDKLSAYGGDLFADRELACQKVESERNVFFDYGGPNVAKPMHVGHLRSGIIGQCLKNLFAFCGDKVTGDVHLGDWGTQMGMMIYALSQSNPELPYFDETFTGPYPSESPVTLDDLQEMYPTISAQCKEDEAVAAKARQATYELQQGRPGYRALWQHFVDVSIEDMKKHYGTLGVSFEQWFGESRYQDRLPDMIERFKKAGIVQESQGALIIPVAQETDKKEVPPLILQKSDGGVLYGTTDLATIEERVEKFGADLSVYVVDARQSLHFEQVFRAAHKAGFESEFEHIGYGTMNGPDGKPFKTRAGGVMRLGDLIEMLHSKAYERICEAGIAKEFSDDEIKHIADCVGVAALKFADLQHDPSQNYIFDLDKFMRFEGKTGPYLLYALVRIKSILRRAEEAGIHVGTIVLEHEKEKELLLTLAQLPDVIMRAYEKRRPNMLCEYAYAIAQTFSKFYGECHVVGAETEAQRVSRASLCLLTQRHLEVLLSIIGINVPHRM